MAIFILPASLPDSGRADRKDQKNRKAFNQLNFHHPLTAQ
jgi:hypothetical protein